MQDQIEDDLRHAADEPVQASKQAACLECRRSKIKCVRSENEDICKKCRNNGTQCVVPEYHVGRYKGVKNKRSGLEKAIHQVEEAIKKAKTSNSSTNDNSAVALQNLLNQGTASTSQQSNLSSSPGFSVQPNHKSQFHPMSPPSRPPLLHSRRISLANESSEADDVTVNNADNPLQLLAIASSIPEQAAPGGTPSTVDKISLGEIHPASSEEDGSQDFFRPISSRLDLSPELDPVQLGLVTLDECAMLFAYFHEKLAHTRWGLDQEIHTTSFVRSRSCFLLTSILAASARFLPTTAALSKRLENHCRFLSQQIILKRFRSVEIVLAFMINIPWMSPGNNWADDDETCSYLSIALTIAIDLSLNKIVLPSVSKWRSEMVQHIPRSDCIDDRRALDIDGFRDVPTSSITGKRLLRLRERSWLALFNLDRGVCLARGRPWTVPSGPLVENCDSWHITDTPTKHDESLVASTILRRDYAKLVAEIRAICDQHHLTVADSSAIVKHMKEKIEGFFSTWTQTWSLQIQQPDGRLPPYLEILVSHCKLSAYCGLVNHPTAAPDVQQFFRAAGLTSAINVLRVAVQSESRLKSMPNNTVIMVSFAACFVLGLSTTRTGTRLRLDPNAQKSIEETADVLERIGSSPAHRNGASALFGRHIRRIMNSHIVALDQQSTNQSQDLQPTDAVPPGLPPYTLISSVGDAPTDLPVFDMMSDDQLLEAIQNAKEDIDAFNAGFQADEGLFMDWLEWPNLT